MIIQSTINNITKKIQTGKTPPTTKKEYFNGEYNWYTPSDLSKKFLSSSIRTLSNKAYEDKKGAFYPKNTILLSCIGDIGKVGITTHEISSSNQQITALIIDKEKIIPEYFYYWCKSHKYIFEQNANNAIVSILNNKKLKDIKIWYEKDKRKQQQIVCFLSQIESLIQKKEKSIELLDQLIRSTFLEMFGNPVSNSKEWEKTTLGKLGDWKSGGTPLRSNAQFYKGNIPWISSGELNQMFISSSNEHITEEAVVNSNTKLIEEGSLLLGMYDTAALKSSINTIKLASNQAIAFSKLDKEKCNTYFIYHLIQIGKDYFKRLQRGGRQKNMNITMVKNIPIILPPHQLQDKFAEIVVKIEDTKKIYQNSLNELNQLFGSVSQKAFKGDLDLSKFELKLEIDNPVEIIELEKEDTKEVKKKEKSLLNKIVDVGLIIGGTVLTAYTVKKVFDSYNKEIENDVIKNGGDILDFTDNIIEYDKEVDLEFDDGFLKNFIKVFQEKESVLNSRLIEELNKIDFKDTPSFHIKKEAFIKLLDNDEIEQYLFKKETPQGFEQDIAFRIKE